ncbi:MAG: hypothetical protein JW900_08130 [Anaerolineae bacterium]|nr:hypothetical protein [Anaerolineae bacterium]
MPNSPIPAYLAQHGEAVQWTLATLRRNTGAHCVLLSDHEGQVLAQAGRAANLSLETIYSTLVKTTTVAACLGRDLDDRIETSMHHYEGGRYQVYAAVAAEGPHLFLLLNQRAAARHSGVVWLFLQRAMNELQQLLQTKKEERSEAADGVFFGSLSMAEARALGLLSEEREEENP